MQSPARQLILGVRRRRRIQMANWLHHLLRCVLLCTLLVGVIVVEQGVRRGWGELSEPGYWAGKAIVFAVVAVVYFVIAAVWGWDPGDKR
jgi:hypothetical protein